MSGAQMLPLAVVTGASSGIGAEFARVLAGRDHRVLAVARRADRLAALADEAAPGRVVPFVADLAAEGAVEAVAERAAELGGASLVVANAGFGRRGDVVDTKPEDAAAMIRLNAERTVEMVHRAVPTMVERGGGGVIVVSSSLAFVPVPHMAVYAATKAFLRSFTHALGEELRGTGVRTMALCPGPTTSEFGEVAGLGDTIEATPGHTTPAQVVAGALRAWDRGRAETVPGGITRSMTAALASLPRGLAVRAMERIFR